MHFGGVWCSYHLCDGWVKASNIDEIKKDIEQLWGEVTKVTVLETKIESIEKGITEIKEMLLSK